MKFLLTMSLGNSGLEDETCFINPMSNFVYDITVTQLDKAFMCSRNDVIPMLKTLKVGIRRIKYLYPTEHKTCHVSVINATIY